MDFSSHIDAVIALFAGGGIGSLLTLKFSKRTTNTAIGSGKVVNQERARAGGDIVGGNKS
jgi:hypothetical protein